MEFSLKQVSTGMTVTELEWSFNINLSDYSDLMAAVAVQRS